MELGTSVPSVQSSCCVEGCSIDLSGSEAGATRGPDVKAGVSAPGIQYVTAPICAIGGVVGGGCYLVGDTVFDLFKKGQDVIFYKGTKFKSKLVYPIDVPVS